MLMREPGTRREERIENELEEHNRTEQAHKPEQRIQVENRECLEHDKKEQP
jgi:hypothetical protein